MNYALIKNGFIENVVVSSPEFASDVLAKMYDHVEPIGDSGAAIGWGWDGSKFVPPPEPEPAPEPEPEADE